MAATTAGFSSAAASVATGASSTLAASASTGAAASSAGFSSSATASSVVSAGFSAGFSVDLPLPLMVWRSLEKGEAFSFFSPSSSEAGDFSFLPKAKGRLDLRFSAFRSFLVSPLVAGVTSVVSVGTVAGEATSAERGSLVSTAGMTGAVSVTGAASVAGTASVSLAGTAGAASGSTFFLPKDRLLKMLFGC